MIPVMAMIGVVYMFYTLHKKSSREIKSDTKELHEIIKDQENQRAYFKNQLEKQSTLNDNPTRNPE